MAGGSAWCIVQIRYSCIFVYTICVVLCVFSCFLRSLLFFGVFTLIGNNMVDLIVFPCQCTFLVKIHTPKENVSHCHRMFCALLTTKSNRIRFKLFERRRQRKKISEMRRKRNFKRILLLLAVGLLQLSSVIVIALSVILILKANE